MTDVPSRSHTADINIANDRTPDHPLKPTNFRKYIGTKIQRYVLPIIPVGAKLKATSRIKPEMLGKIPGLVSDNGEWAGFPWPESVPTEGALVAYESWQAEFGIIVPLATRLGDMIIVIDLDIENEIYLNAVRALAEQHFGVTPVVRRRDGSIRCVLVYRHKAHTPPIRKFAGAYKDEQGQKQLVEVLGTGCLVVLEGPHAKGAMHYWEGDRELVDYVEELPEITREMVSAFYMELDDVATTAFGYVKHKLSLPSGGDSNRPAFKVADPDSPHLAKDRELLTEALGHIDLDHPDMDYDAFIKLLRAICASVAGDLAYLREVVWPWVCTNQKEAHGEGPRTEERGVEWLEERWASFTDSQLGIKHVYELAADFGFGDGVAALTKEIMAGAPPLGLAPDEGDAGSVSASVAGAGNGQGIPPGPIPPTDTHWDLAAAFVDVYGLAWRYNVDAKRWFKFEEHIWQPNDTLQDTVGRMLADLGLRIYQTVNGASAEKRYRILRSWGTVMSVMRMLQGLPQMIVREEDFDAHPHLLNTPGGVVDLRTGAISDHDPLLLMRNITRFAPDYFALGEYDRKMPRFMRVLANVAMKDPDIVPALRAWGAYILTGEQLHQALAFFHGAPGVGKSLIFQVFCDIMYTYAKLLDEAFFSKNGGDGKRFDMAALIGKRMGFMDETQLGMTWDETRMSKGASAKKLNAELKFGRIVEFANTAKVCIIGNHKPNFVAADTGGLTSRMLLFEAAGINYREPGSGGIDKLSDIIVEEEGPAIFMWLLEACVADYNTPGLFNERTRKQREAAKAYAAEDSLLQQWVRNEMCISEKVDIDTMEALEKYIDFCKRIKGKAPNIQLSSFKQALQAAFPTIRFGNRKTRPHPNRACVYGLGYPRFESGDSENVVPFPGCSTSDNAAVEKALGDGQNLNI